MRQTSASNRNGEGTSGDPRRPWRVADYHYMGRWREAEFHYRQAREIFDQIGDVYNRVFANNNLGGIARNQERLGEALAFYQEGLRSLERISFDSSPPSV